MEQLKKKWSGYHPTFVSSMLAGFLAFGWFFTNKLINYDDITYFFTKGASLKSGRWGLDLLDLLIPSYSLPWLWGTLSVIFISAAVMIYVSSLQIRSKLVQILTATCPVVFGSQLGIFRYMFTTIYYAIAFFMTSVSFALLTTEWKEKKSRTIAVIVALILEVLSLSIYQAYITMLSSMMLVLLVKKLITCDSERFNIKSFLFSGLKFLSFLAVSLALYYGITLILLKINGMSFGSYAQKHLTQDSTILQRLREAFFDHKYILFDTKYALIPSNLSRIAHLLCFGAAGLSGLMICIKGKDRFLRIVVYLFLTVILLPASISGLTLLLGTGANRNLTLMGYTSVYFLSGILVDCAVSCKYVKKIFRPVVLTGMAVIAVCNIFYANKIALLTYLDYQNTYSFYTSVLTQVEMTPGYTQDEKIIFCGYQDYTPGYEENFVKTIQEVYAFPSFRHFCRKKFVSYYIGLDLNIEENTNVIQSILDTPEVQAMPSYPNNGCVQNFGDYIVVKLSDSMYLP